MSQVITNQEAEQAIAQVIERAQTDSEFRQLCLSNPNAAAREATGKDIPEDFTLKFVDNQGADLTVVLPDLVDSSVELSNAELEQVAGGNEKCGRSCGVSCVASDIPGEDLNIDIKFN